MRAGKLAAALIVLLALGVAGLALEVRSQRLEQRRLSERLHQLEQEKAQGEELADWMLKMQIHADKLYFAGLAGNWDLAAFYLEELGETAEDIAARDLIEGEVDISAVMQSLIPIQLEELGEALGTRDPEAFSASYRTLTQVCNSCHRSTGHGFVVVQEPRQPAVTGQRYEPAAEPEVPALGATPSGAR